MNGTLPALAMPGTVAVMDISSSDSMRHNRLLLAFGLVTIGVGAFVAPACGGSTDAPASVTTPDASAPDVQSQEDVQVQEDAAEEPDTQQADAPTVDSEPGNDAQGDGPSNLDAQPDVPPAPNGEACSADSQCLSGFCVDSVCCDTACGGGTSFDCQVCAVSAGAAVDGTCTTLPGEDGPKAPLAGALQTDLVALYRFDECAGVQANESTGLGVPGVLHNFPTNASQWQAGKVGHALHFRGPADMDYVVAPTYEKPAGSMTISAWVWADSYAPWASIVKNWGQKPGQFHFGLDGAVLDVYFDGQSAKIAETAVFPIGSWEHVAFVADSASKTLLMYHNGVVSAGPENWDGALVYPPLASLGIGVKTDDMGLIPDPLNPGYWDGLIDDLAIWKRALTASEINLVYTSGQSGVGIGEIQDN